MRNSSESTMFGSSSAMSMRGLDMARLRVARRQRRMACRAASSRQRKREGGTHSGCAVYPQSAAERVDDLPADREAEAAAAARPAHGVSGLAELLEQHLLVRRR